MTGHESLGRWSEDKFLLDFDGAKIRRVDLPSRVTFRVVPLLRIKHQEGMRQGEGKKYLRESCFHCIKCSVANSLTALM